MSIAECGVGQSSLRMTKALRPGGASEGVFGEDGGIFEGTGLGAAHVFIRAAAPFAVTEEDRFGRLADLHGLCRVRHGFALPATDIAGVVVVAGVWIANGVGGAFEARTL